MTARQRMIKGGFTLVEILIVVVILGILAAIVIPQFTSASETAKASSLQSQLQTIRSQLELYQVQHNGMYPLLSELSDATNPWGPLVETTDLPVDSSASYSGTLGDTDNPFGPYMQKPPANPFTASATNASVAASAAAGVAWEYNETTGRIRAVLPANIDAANLGLEDTNDFVQVGG